MLVLEVVEVFVVDIGGVVGMVVIGVVVDVVVVGVMNFQNIHVSKVLKKLMNDLKKKNKS